MTRLPDWCLALCLMALPLVSTGAEPSTRAPAPQPAVAQAVQSAMTMPELKSASFVVMDESDSSVLFARKADAVVPVASITKLMTALVLLDADQPMDELIEITSADRDLELGTTSRLAIGTRLSREDMLYLALMSSENRAAHALGRNYPGGLPAFIKAMNSKAAALGMKHTRFVDPTGLSRRNVSSATDLTRLVIASAREPDIGKYSTHRSLTVRVGQQLLEFHNTNTLVTKPDWDISVQKTGYTRDAGQCLVMKAVIKGRPVVIVLLNSFGKYTRVADARRIRKWMEAVRA
jgi:serine-type D-Ala-D-Ala endopeptidase (penicillin-binding protein 7)